MRIKTIEEMKTVFTDKPATIDVDLNMVQNILNEIKTNGDKTLKKYTLQFDKVSLENFKIDNNKFIEAYDQLDHDTIKALENSAHRLKTFAQKQLEQNKDFEFELEPGVWTGQRVIPIGRVGVYVPGGNFPLVSSLLMGTVPARVAGVNKIAVCTPPNQKGEINPAMLAAAHIANVDELYTIGGIQAIGALAYGTESIQAVDTIVGPGNKYVTAAKKLVYGDVGIDFIAGPSEVLIIADDSAEPSWIAADLLAQAEHDINAISILVTTSKELAQKVNEEVNRQLKKLDTQNIANQALEKNGCIVLAESIEQALDFSNQKAPEHLEIHINNPDSIIQKLKNYGSLFIGKYAAEVFGDYSSGLNHTLPTSGAARYTGGLSVRDFIKVQTTLRSSKQGIARIGEDSWKMAKAEGLSAHANAAKIRMKRGR